MIDESVIFNKAEYFNDEISISDIGFVNYSFSKNIKNLIIQNLILEYKKNAAEINFMNKLTFSKNNCFVHNLFINEKSRGEGFGGYLIKELTNYCNHHSIDCIYLIAHVQHLNHDLVRFYRNTGFEIVQKIDNKSFLMKKNLT